MKLPVLVLIVALWLACASLLAVGVLSFYSGVDAGDLVITGAVGFVLLPYLFDFVRKEVQ